MIDIQELLQAIHTAKLTTVGIREHLEDYQINPVGLQGQIEQSKLVELVELQLRLRELHEEIDAAKSDVGKTFDWMRINVVPEACERDGVSTSNFPGIGRLSLQSDVNVKVLDKSAEYLWLETIGEGNAITETVNASTLKAIIRRRLKAGEEIPDNVFQVQPFTRAAITKA